MVPGDIPLAYAVVVSGSLIHKRRLVLRHDLSYGVYIYGFPVHQFLVICGLASLNPVLFSVLATTVALPLAALSWFWVEKPAMSLKTRLRKQSAGRSPKAFGDGDAKQIVPGAQE